MTFSIQKHERNVLIFFLAWQKISSLKVYLWPGPQSMQISQHSVLHWGRRWSAAANAHVKVTSPEILIFNTVQKHWYKIWELLLQRKFNTSRSAHQCHSSAHGTQTIPFYPLQPHSFNDRIEAAVQSQGAAATRDSLHFSFLRQTELMPPSLNRVTFPHLGQKKTESTARLQGFLFQDSVLKQNLWKRSRGRPPKPEK